jgi:ABC-type transport system involved in multi-copper enzyme maturation permease subunit
MRSPARTPFAAIFRNEVLLNSKRIAPYALMILFAANAALWCAAGAAVHHGWATNSDFYIHRNFAGFTFITGLPLFTALIMGDPVIRDFRLGVDPLIFSKPVRRAAYLLGKFFGNFFVLVCCHAAFALTLLLLQVFRTSQMIVLPVRVFPYFKTLLFSRGHLAVSPSRLLLYRRNSYKEFQNRLRLGRLFLPALHCLSGGLIEEPAAALAHSSRSFAI